MYKYQELRSQLFTDEGQRLFLRIRDHMVKLLKTSGACTMEMAIRGASGDDWIRMACVDRLVELEEIVEVHQEHPAGQHRIFRLQHWGMV